MLRAGFGSAAATMRRLGAIQLCDDLARDNHSSRHLRAAVGGYHCRPQDRDRERDFLIRAMRSRNGATLAREGAELRQERENSLNMV
jgi:hypothetical protein